MRVFVRVGVAVLCGALAVCCQDDPEGTSAGGQWIKANITDNPSSTRAVEFYLVAEDAELGRHPEIQFICNGDGKVLRVRYFADAKLRALIGDYKNYDQPALAPKITIDKKHRVNGIWDLWVDRTSMLLDRTTIRAILKSKQMLVQYRDRVQDHFNDFFVTEGLDKKELERACGNNGWFN